MKHFKIILSMATAVFCFTAATAQSPISTLNKAAADTALSACSMKCEGDKINDKAAKCGMNSKASKDVTAAVYQCPMKCEGDKTYDKAGKCPKCKMNLTEAAAGKDTPGQEHHNHN